jgi:hypothetical protein
MLLDPKRNFLRVGVAVQEKRPAGGGRGGDGLTYKPI